MKDVDKANSILKEWFIDYLIYGGFMNKYDYTNDTIIEVLEDNNFFAMCEHIFYSITDAYKYEVVSYIKENAAYGSNRKSQTCNILNCGRKYVLKSISDQTIDYGNIKHAECKLLYGRRLIEFSKDKLLCLLSLFNRREFDYLVEKYYRFNKIPYNNAYEEKISDVFNGKKDARGYYYSNSLPFVDVEALDLYGCLDDFPEYFFYQIDNRDELLKHSSYYKRRFIAKKVNGYNVSLKSIVVTIVLLIIIAACMQLFR